MTPHPTFTAPSADITTARLALARLQRHLAEAVDPLHVGDELTSLAFAVLTVEDIHPPYPPLPEDIGPSSGLRADLAAATDALLAASSAATTARETLRLAYAIRDLRGLERSPRLAAAGPGGQG